MTYLPNQNSVLTDESFTITLVAPNNTAIATTVNPIGAKHTIEFSWRSDAGSSLGPNTWAVTLQATGTNTITATRASAGGTNMTIIGRVKTWA